MARKNFSKKTRRAALARSGMLCEAIGAMYGLEPGKRCNAPLSAGVEFDHIVLDANSHDDSLENCASVCIKCHKLKTAKHDIPMAAKTVRMQDKFNRVTQPKQTIKSQPFPHKQRAEKLPPPPRRNLFTHEVIQ